MLRVLGDMRDLVERYGVPASDKAAVADVHSQAALYRSRCSLGRGQAVLVSLSDWQVMRMSNSFVIHCVGFLYQELRSYISRRETGKARLNLQLIQY